MKRCFLISMTFCLMAVMVSLCLPLSLYAKEHEYEQHVKKRYFYRSMGDLLEKLVASALNDSSKVSSMAHVPTLTLLTLAPYQESSPEPERDPFFKNVQLIVGSVIAGYPDDSAIQGELLTGDAQLSLRGGYEGGIFLGARHNLIFESLEVINSGNIRLIAGRTLAVMGERISYGALGLSLSSGMLWSFPDYKMRVGTYVQLTMRADFLSFQTVKPFFPLALGLHLDRGAHGGLYVRIGYVFLPQTFQQGFQFVLGFSYQSW